MRIPAPPPVETLASLLPRKEPVPYIPWDSVNRYFSSKENVPANLTQEQAKRIDQLANGCKAVNREIRKLKVELAALGLRFPDSLPVLLDRIDMDVDAVFVILNTPHIKSDAAQ